jgi:ribosomal protein L7Ae-like RNA K-turn-binding protein
MNAFFQMLGIAQRARAVESGTTACEVALKRGKARLLILSRDLSKGAFDKIGDQAVRQGVPVLTVADRQSLGKALGHDERAVVAITDERLAERLMQLGDETEEVALWSRSG